MGNILLYFSAFMPMYFLILVKQLIEIITNKISFNLLALVVLVFIILLIGLGVLGLFLEMRNNKKGCCEVYVISKQNITDEHFLGYFSLFVLFSISFDLSKLSMFIVFILILIMIGVVYIKNKLFYINPLLNIFGYNFYNIKYKSSNEEEEKSTKIFFKGDLVNNKTYLLKIKDENFAFLDKEK